MTHEQDIFDLSNIRSVPRERLRKGGPIKLANIHINSLDPINFNITEIRFNAEQSLDTQIKQRISPIRDKLTILGFDGDKLYTAIYEAVRNAHQHGNKSDHSKPVKVGLRYSKDHIECIVSDLGQELDPEFASYVLFHRLGCQDEVKPTDFYSFTGREKPNPNNGTGTYFMHLYSDEVKYCISPEGGLLVLLSQKKRERKTSNREFT
ncbi:MAG: ATP-binding protein [Candidatus Woesearchaeota archaeon]